MLGVQTSKLGPPTTLYTKSDPLDVEGRGDYYKTTTTKSLKPFSIYTKGF
jgi:hypothetical protein